MQIEIKKWWLFIFVISVLVSIVSTIRSLTGVALPFPILQVALSLGVPLLFFLSLFYFGYYKGGTRFLAFYIVFFLIGIATSCIAALGLWFFADAESPIIQSIYGGILSSVHQIGFVLVGFSQLVNFVFLYLNIKLLKINRARKLADSAIPKQLEELGI